MEQRLDVIDVIRELAGGVQVDWSAVDDKADQRTRHILDALQIVSRIAQLHGGDGKLLAETFATSSAVTPSSDLRSWGPLVVLEPVGRGAYGDVYRAWDPRLDREVALKILRRVPPEQRGIAVNEGTLLARVRHPNVVTVYGADHVNGRVGIWMEFCSGHTLQESIDRHGPLSAREVTLIGIEICRGLAAVHRASLVHGDVNARNVMRDGDGRVTLMDFGTSGHIQNSSHGPVAGTPLYTAPELLEGSPATVRSDLYSLGVLLHYLVSGVYPVSGTTVSDVRAAHSHHRRQSLATVRPGLPSSLVNVIEQALSADPSDRFDSAETFEAALQSIAEPRAPERSRVRRFGVLLGAAGVLAAAFAAFALSDAEIGPVQSGIRLAPREDVLITKFENRTGEPVFDGAVEYALLRGLSDSDVIGLVSDERVADALRMMKRPPDTTIDRATGREIALRDGHVKALLVGRVERFGSSYVITASLVDPADDRVVTTIAEQATSQSTVVGALSRQASRVRETLGEKLPHIRGVVPLEPAATASLEAFQLYSESYRLGRQNRWAAAQAIARRMVEVDPEFASGWMWLAWTVRNTERPGELTADDPRIEKYRAFADRAMRVANQVPEWERHWLTGSYYTLTGDPARAIPHYEALLRLRPDHYYASNNLLNARIRLHRREDYPEFLALLQRRGEQRPNDPNLVAAAAQAAVHVTGQAPQAKRYVDRLRTLSAMSGETAARARFWGDFADAYVRLRTEDFQGTLAQLRAIQRAINSYPTGLRTQAILGVVDYYLSLGRSTDAVSFVGSLQNPVEKELGELGLAWEVDDRVTLQRLLSPHSAKHPPTSFLIGPVYIRAGLYDLARDYIGRETVEEGFVRIARGQLSLERGDAAAALGDLERGVELISTYNSPAYWWGCEAYADALTRLRRRTDAIAALETCSSNDFKTIAVWAPLGIVRMSFDANLAQLYRRAGRNAAAQELEGRLRSRLALADRNFPLLQQLNAN